MASIFSWIFRLATLWAISMRSKRAGRASGTSTWTGAWHSSAFNISVTVGVVSRHTCLGRINVLVLCIFPPFRWDSKEVKASLLLHTKPEEFPVQPFIYARRSTCVTWAAVSRFLSSSSVWRSRSSLLCSTVQKMNPISFEKKRFAWDPFKVERPDEEQRAVEERDLLCSRPAFAKSYRNE